MANTFAPYGFLQYQGGAGGAPTFAQSTRKIASGNSTAVYTGDPVMPVTGTANGYITQAAAGTTAVAGIFVGCRYVSSSQKRVVWSAYWPGSDATSDVDAYVIDDPNARFIVQSSGSNFPITGTLSAQGSGVQGQYAQFTIGTGNTATGRSGSYISSIGTTVTYPFIVVDYATSFGNGGDPTTQYCNLIVGFNNEVWRTNGAGPTGIS
jgi:hypothetical protein